MAFNKLFLFSTALAFRVLLQSQMTLILWTEEQLNKKVEKNSVKSISEIIIVKHVD